MRAICASTSFHSPCSMASRAPGYYTGYGVKTMPGAREAIEQGEWNDVDAQIARIAGVLMAEATVAHQAAMAFEPAK